MSGLGMATGTYLLLAHLAGVGAPAAQAMADTLLANGRSAVVQPASTATRRDQIAFDASRFDSITANTLRGLFEDAAELGLPTRPLINRALEGAARRMTSERILRVVREHLAALVEARQALGPRSTDDELDAAASAIKAGIEPGTISALRATRPMGEALVPLVVLTDIVRRGVPAASAREAVTTLARAPRADDALLGLQATVAKNAQRGPGMALQALQRYVKNTAPGSAPPPPPATPERKPVRPPDQ